MPTTATSLPSIHTTNGSRLQITHTGHATSSSLSLPDTYLVPHLSFNLISIGQLCDIGLTVLFSSSGCQVQDPQTGQILGTGRKVGRLFELTSLHISSSPVSAAVTSVSPSYQWHLRLGHASASKLRVLASRGLLDSVKLESFDCLHCHLAKQPTLSFHNSNSSTTFPFQLIHSDIWGPSPVASINGYRYFVLFIDDYSRFTWVYFMKHKSELCQIYKNFVVMIKTQFSYTIQTLRTDNAMEYQDSTLLQFLASQGTVVQRSCPYTSQQNGRAERKHRHILDSVRAQLLSASCPEKFWGEATLTAVHTINCLPTLVLGNLSPFERLHGKPPPYSYLKPFGCTCFVLLPSHERTKLQPRARLCCFLGYGLEHKGYRCWDPISNRLRISRHVVFWEHTTFSSLSKFSDTHTVSPSFFTEPSVELFPSDDADLSEVQLQVPSFTPQDSAPAVDPVTEASIATRRSTRVRETPSHLRDYHCFSAFTSLYEPSTYKEASTNPLWQQAMSEELQAL